MGIKTKISVQEMHSGKPVAKEKPATSLDIVKSDEKWSVFELEDGTTVKVKQTILQVIKADDLDKNGKPIYSIQVRPDIVFLPKV